MRDTIYREEAINKIAEHLGVPAENWMKIAEEWIKDVPSAAQPECIQNNAVHLCDSCRYTYVTCPSHGNDAVFGDGKGNDNICACNKYQPISAQPEQQNFEKQIHAMFDHIWDCEIDHPVFQDTVGDLMGAVIQCHKGLPPAEPEEIALHESCADCPLYDKDRHSCPRFNKVIPEVLREVQSESRWVSIRERLPSNFETVYATCRSLVDDRENWVIEGIYTNLRGWNMTPMIECGDAEVIAWMPKTEPEPYQIEPEHTMEEFMFGQDLGNPEDGSL